VLDLDMPEQTVLSTDQLRLVVDAFARFRITNPQRMYETVGSEERVAEALSRMARALAELRIDGIRTTAPFHQRLLQADEFRRGDVHTGFVEQFLKEAR